MTLVEQLLNKLNISYKLQRHGKELLFNCIAPDHNDRHASCSINVDTGQWLCWSCLKKGNLQAFLRLANINQESINEFITPKDKVQLKINTIYKSSSKNILTYEQDVAFNKVLSQLLDEFVPATTNKESLFYLVKKRKLTKETIRKFRLMYATSGQYAERIIIPYYHNGELIGFNSRYIGNNKRTLRYLYYINTEKFEKFIYNYENILNKQYCIITEGPFDLMYLAQCGYKNVLSTLNTSINHWQLAKLLEFAKIIFCFDNDKNSQAGQNAVLKHAGHILSIDENTPVYKVELPEGQDPNECTTSILQSCFSQLKRIKPVETSTACS